MSRTRKLSLKIVKLDHSQLFDSDTSLSKPHGFEQFPQHLLALQDRNSKDLFKSLAPNPSTSVPSTQIVIPMVRQLSSTFQEWQPQSRNRYPASQAKTIILVNATHPQPTTINEAKEHRNQGKPQDHTMLLRMEIKSTHLEQMGVFQSPEAISVGVDGPRCRVAGLVIE